MNIESIFGSLAISIALVGLASAAEMLSGRASVIDGDTIEIHGQRIRFHGIDAPESNQTCTGPNGVTWRCGQSAAIALADKIGTAPVVCEQTDVDQYQRVVAICSQRGEDINAWLVSEGWAVAYRTYSLDYVPNEARAKMQRLGIWAGEFVVPSEFRNPPSSSQPQEAPQDGCVIKGNTNRAGNRIYHVPGQRDYSRTVVSTDRGERWFCSEEEAVRAGWRRAAR